MWPPLKVLKSIHVLFFYGFIQIISDPTHVFVHGPNLVTESGVHQLLQPNCYHKGDFAKLFFETIKMLMYNQSIFQSEVLIRTKIYQGLMMKFSKSWINKKELFNQFSSNEKQVTMIDCNVSVVTW